MNSYSYRPRGVCASQIRFDLEDGKLHNIAFTGGCHWQAARGRGRRFRDPHAQGQRLRRPRNFLRRPAHQGDRGGAAEGSTDLNEKTTGIILRWSFIFLPREREL